MITSEKTTDLLVFSLLRENGYVDGGFNSLLNDVQVWTNKSSNSAINDLLSRSSKKLTGNYGYPEFLIFDEKNNLIIVIENKRDPKKHIGSNIEKNVSEYAVNGAIWYAKHLSKKYDVIAVGISGAKRSELIINHYLWRKGSESFNNLDIDSIKPLSEYLNLVNHLHVEKSEKQILIELRNKSKEINEFLRNILGVIEHERLYLLGSILYALEDPMFRMSYGLANNNETLAISIYQAVERRIQGSKIQNKEMIIAEIKPVLLGFKNDEKEGVKEEYPNGSLYYLVSTVERTLLNLHKNREIDLISSFFNVFLSYSTSGGSDLGIVLTPPHITELFCDLADISIESKILDICVGTGGFLTRAWRKIALSNEYSYTEKESFRENNIVGIEIERSIYTIVALNMFLNRDGRTNLFFGDAFKMKSEIRKLGCNVGFINPPYSDSIYSEIYFVEAMLDMLLPNSIGVAIIPVNAVSSRTKKHSDILSVKKRILEKNILIASIQMPINLFYPKGTETVILVFKTGHENIGKTWMARFDDGFELIKHQSTRTPSAQSEIKKKKLIDAFNEKKETDFSFNKKMTYEMQWVYEVHNDFNYEINIEDLQQTVNEYISYLYANNYK